MADGALRDVTPWQRRSLTIPPDSWRAWIHLAVWEAWMGMLLFGFIAFGVSLIATSGDRIVTFVDLSHCYAPPPVTLPCEKIIRVGGLNAMFSALGGLMSLVASAWLLWELWSAAAPKPITDDFLQLLHNSFAHDWRDPRTWPWSRVLWAYGLTSLGVLLAGTMVLLIWTADAFRRPVKTPVIKVDTLQEFRIGK